MPGPRVSRPIFGPILQKSLIVIHYKVRFLQIIDTSVAEPDPEPDPVLDPIRIRNVYFGSGSETGSETGSQTNQ
jgi:hypothetical protein